MRISNIAMQNLRRRRTRAILLLVCFVLGVASIVFLYTTSQAMQEDMANKLDQYGSNIIITPDNEGTLTFDGVTVDAPQEVKGLNISIVAQMKTIKNRETLATIAPELLADTELKGQRLLLVGVDFRQELRLKKWWQVEGLNAQQIPTTHQVLLGSDVAKALGAKQGQTLQIKGQVFQVAGIINVTGDSGDDQSIFLDLATLQQLTNKPGAVSLVEAAAFCWSCPIDQVTQQLRAKLPGTKVTAVRASIQSRNDTITKFNSFALYVSLILLLTSILVVGMTMLASVKERTRDIGILRAMGYRQSHIIRIILTEAGSLSLAGGLIGYGLGMGATVGLGPVIVGSQTTVAWQPLIALYAVAASLSIGLIASGYPALRAARFDPVEALRYL